MRGDIRMEPGFQGATTLPSATNTIIQVTAGSTASAFGSDSAKRTARSRANSGGDW
jgi:hypothetical protein